MRTTSDRPVLNHVPPGPVRDSGGPRDERGRRTLIFPLLGGTPVICWQEVLQCALWDTDGHGPTVTNPFVWFGLRVCCWWLLFAGSPAPS